MSHVFVYGSLLFPEIVSGLIGRQPPSKPAILNHYARCYIDHPDRSAKGPAITPCEHHHVNGKVLLELQDKEKHILDLFEQAAEGFTKQTLSVRTNNHSDIEANAYVADKSLRPYLSDNDWSEDVFREKHLEHYINERIPALLQQWKDEGLLQYAIEE